MTPPPPHAGARLRLYPETGCLRLRDTPGSAAAPRHGGLRLADDVRADPAARAALLGRPGAVLCLHGAAWVHAGRHAPGAPPAPEHAPLPGRRRDALPRQLRLRPADVQRLGLVAVTGPERTALDLARLAGEDEAVAWIAAMVRGGADLIPLARRCAGHPRRPGARVTDVLYRALLAGGA